MQSKNTHYEFIALMASLMSLVALSIDALLPALSAIGTTVGVKNPADNQLLISFIFLGLGSGQLIFGPLSDSYGRKPMIYTGFIIFVIASIICVQATSLEMMLLGRLLQGIGLSGPRTISTAMVRDSFSGDYMARIMSFVTVIFIIVPIVAPTLGKIALDIYGWKFIFLSQLIYGLVIVLWLYKRQPETLSKSHRKRFSLRLFSEGILEFIKYKQAIIYTLISGFITGSFMVYLSSAEHIFTTQFDLQEEFPFIFAILAIGVGLATFLNGTFVVRYGMFKIVRLFLIVFSSISLAYLLLFNGQSNPPVYVILIFFMLQFFALGFLFGNLRALAMQPIGHIAGMGAAINGFVSTIMAVPIATWIGRYLDENVMALFVGFFICGCLSLFLQLLSQKK